jgi:uncharacterized membrane protein
MGFWCEIVTSTAELSVFVGRLHPLVVHLPIGILLLLAVLELVGWRRPSLRLPPAVRTVVLLIAVLSASMAAACGWLLASKGGYDETLLERHRWLGVGTAGFALVLLLVRRWPRPYGAFLAATVAALAVAGHDGGSLTHGRYYLAEAAPGFLRPLWGDREVDTPPPVSLAEADAYQHVVRPILNARCASCHGESKSDGDLRLDSLANLWEGGKHGAVIEPGDATMSPLLQRVYLPLSDRKHMPPAGRPQPTEAEIAVLEWWINQGAPEEARVADLAPSREMATVMALQLGLPPPALPDRAAMLVAAAQLEQELGIIIRPLTAAEPWLAANARLQDTQFGDQQLAALSPIAAALHRLDLGGTAITDAGLVQVRKMDALRRLQLDATAITDAGLVHLEPLTQLESLNLHTTAVTDAGLEPLRALPRLRRLYVWQTAVTPTATQELAARLENRRQLQRYRQELATLESRLAAETFRSDFGAEPPVAVAPVAVLPKLVDDPDNAEIEEPPPPITLPSS